MCEDLVSYCRDEMNSLPLLGFKAQINEEPKKKNTYGCWVICTNTHGVNNEKDAS